MNTVTQLDAQSYLETAPPDAPMYAPSPTAEDLILSMAGGDNEPLRLLLLQGPRGEGKTTAGIYACQGVAHRMRLEGKHKLLPIRVAVVRDTWINLERTTLVSFEENAAKGMPLQWLNGKREALVGDLHFYFFGLDNRADADKLQGFQCGILWLEEVAPAAELATGIPAEALAIGITSVRQAGVPKRVLITFNPPDEDHWVVSTEETLRAQGQGDILVHKFVIAPNEKADHFRRMALQSAQMGLLERAAEWERAADEFEAYRRRNRLALESIGRTDLVARLVEGRVGGVTVGEPVVPGFDSDKFVTQKPIALIPGAQMLRLWDAGLTPSTVWVQVTPMGNIDILGSRTSTNRDMADHIQHEVWPFQQKYGLIRPRPMGAEDGFGQGARQGWHFRDIGDSACLYGSNQAVKRELTAAWVIERLCHTAFEPGPIPWAPRREALLFAFRHPGFGKDPDRPRRIRIYGPENKMLIQALNGRARYPTNPATGRINDTVQALKRESGIYFQALDALAYGLAVLFPVEEELRKIYASPVPSGPAEPRGRSWLSV